MTLTVTGGAAGVLARVDDMRATADVLDASYRRRFARTAAELILATFEYRALRRARGQPGSPHQ